MCQFDINCNTQEQNPIFPWRVHPEKWFSWYNNTGQLYILCNVWNDFKAALILIWFHMQILCVPPLTLCHTAHFQIHFSDANWMKRLNKPSSWIF